MTAAEAIRHLTARVRVQRHEKTSYNRLRWTETDLDATDALITYALKAAHELREQREQHPPPLIVRPHELAPDA